MLSRLAVYKTQAPVLNTDAEVASTQKCQVVDATHPHITLYENVS